MATVELSFTPLPAHVRTARLVATAVARRSRVEESLLDEVRLAVGEACSRAVEAHRMYCPAEPVRIELSDRDGRFEVVVTDAAPTGGNDGTEPGHAAAPGSGSSMAGDSVPAAAPTGAAATADAATADTAATANAAAAATAGPVADLPPSAGTPAESGPGASGSAGYGAAAQAAAAPAGAASASAVSAGGVVDDSAVNGSLPADIGLAVIEGLADDVEISATDRGVTIRMSWPVQKDK